MNPRALALAAVLLARARPRPAWADCGAGLVEDMENPGFCFPAYWPHNYTLACGEHVLGNNVTVNCDGAQLSPDEENLCSKFANQPKTNLDEAWSICLQHAEAIKHDESISYGNFEFGFEKCVQVKSLIAEKMGNKNTEHRKSDLAIIERGIRDPDGKVKP